MVILFPNNFFLMLITVLMCLVPFLVYLDLSMHLKLRFISSKRPHNPNPNNSIEQQQQQQQQQLQLSLQQHQQIPQQASGTSTQLHQQQVTQQLRQDIPRPGAISFQGVDIGQDRDAIKLLLEQLQQRFQQ
jgi:hypothetical protein